jgi:peroxiredoxin
MLKHPPSEESHVPDVSFKTRVYDESIGGENPFRWQEVTSEELFGNKKIVLFALPGAFTPTCSSTHAPGYEKHYDEFKKLEIDEVMCLSVNDAFVMYQWAQKLGIEHVHMLPDGNGEFTRKMGMLVKKHNLGFGDRSWRYSMYIENGVIRKMFIEKGFSDDCQDDPFEVSDAETMLRYLTSVK